MSSSPASSPPLADPGDPVLALDGPLTLATVAAWRPRLAAALASPRGLALDPRSADPIDGFGVQLLCSARRSAMLAARPFRLSAFPDALAQACARVGVPVSHLADFNPAQP